MDPPPPSLLHWLRLRPLGFGSFARVSLALNLSHGFSFAVKSTPASFPPSPQLLALESEISILLSLRSPRIVSFLGHGFSSDAGLPSRNLFLEYLDGGSVADLVKKSGGRLDERRVRCFSRCIVEGLAYVHEQGVVHCDIKGHNVLVGTCGVKIADFGAAKRVPEREFGTPSGGQVSFRGTPLWMAPEVLQGEEQGFASDVWSLGCTVVEMLQGCPPWGESFASSSPEAFLFKIACSQENPTLPDSFSDETKDFLSKCLHRNPNFRWTASQLLQHPFLASAPQFDETMLSDPRCLQSSPRSTLDAFLSSDSNDRSYDEEFDASVIAPHPPCSAKRRLVMDPSQPSSPSPVNAEVSSSPVSVPEDCDWLTVKRAAKRPRQGGDVQEIVQMKPFMQDVPPVLIKKGCEVNLDCISFLIRRRAPTVVGVVQQ